MGGASGNAVALLPLAVHFAVAVSAPRSLRKVERGCVPGLRPLVWTTRCGAGLPDDERALPVRVYYVECCLRRALCCQDTHC